MQWKKVSLVGVGLLGGSLGKALKDRHLAGLVTGYVRRAASVNESQRLHAVDRATRDLGRAIEEADLVVLCTPIAQMGPLVKLMLPSLKRGAIVTDVGSVKGSVIRDLERLVSHAGGHFVGSHPMAGAEKMGVAAARADLFAGAVCVVTPTRKTNRAALRRVERLWKAVGSRVVRLSPEVHDELVSRSSHLPHLVAAGLANFILSPKHAQEQALLCANGFRDTTRIASGSPEMWRDIAVANRKELGRTLGVFIANLERVRRLIAQGNPRAIEKFLAEAKARRDEWQSDATAASPE